MLILVACNLATKIWRILNESELVKWFGKDSVVNPSNWAFVDFWEKCFIVKSTIWHKKQRLIFAKEQNCRSIAQRLNRESKSSNWKMAWRVFSWREELGGSWMIFESFDWSSLISSLFSEVNRCVKSSSIYRKQNNVWFC